MTKSKLSLKKGFTRIVDFRLTKILNIFAGRKTSFSSSRKFTTGFTLIELLVVISIIGFLSSVVLASLNVARGKGNIAAIQSTLKNIAPQAELSYSDTGNYSAIVASSSAILKSLSNANATGTCYTNNGSRWGCSARLNSDPTKYWSVSDQSAGVVQWDSSDQTINGQTYSWSGAMSQCASIGKRLPTVEEFSSMCRTSSADCSTKEILTGSSNGYWTSTVDPNNSSTNAFVTAAGGVYWPMSATMSNPNSYRAHCVY